MASIVFILLLIVLSCHGLPERYRSFSLREKRDAQIKYRPVVLIHGLFGKNSSLQEMEELIKKIDGFYKEMLPVMNESENGVNLLGYSQGGLIARGIAQTKNDHNIHNLITISAPLAGHYGNFYLANVGMTKETAYFMVYLNKMFKSYSVAQYWNDPHQRKHYLKHCEFLPYINNEIEGKEKKEYAKNFARLNKLVLIGGPDDGVVSPWQSSRFSFYDEKENVVDFRKRDIYTKDLFGLKTLDVNNKIQIYERKGIGHYDWPKKEDVITDFVLPWLD
ncbi:Lysosomal thioesterase PPT2-B [Armadillidium nasatum]|uniref:palmitoyl-CoA hydrolase n=1 Tax=Armadillidium nasatum TaxID=96803 RepID=A0A5N5TCE1_9CRUS|nr:Lysosomal thioesterase PPT2-B [Armadillidium nasatum]